MTFREDAEAALRAGQNAEPGAPNPYNPSDPLLARVWMRGYRTMLTIRSASTLAMQEYLRARRDGVGHKLGTETRKPRGYRD